MPADPRIDQGGPQGGDRSQLAPKPAEHRLVLFRVDIPGSQLRLRQAQYGARHLWRQRRIIQQPALKQPAYAAVELAGVHVMMTGHLGHHKPAPVWNRKRRLFVGEAHVVSSHPLPVNRPGNGEEDLVNHVHPDGLRRDAHAETAVLGRRGRQRRPETVCCAAITHHGHLDRRAARPYILGQVLAGKERGIVVDLQNASPQHAARSDRLTQGAHRGAGAANDTPQYRCCCPVRATVVSTPAVRVPLLACQRSARPSLDRRTPLWSRRYKSRANSGRVYSLPCPGSKVSTDQMSTRRTTASAFLPSRATTRAQALAKLSRNCSARNLGGRCWAADSRPIRTDGRSRRSLRRSISITESPGMIRTIDG